MSTHRLNGLELDNNSSCSSENSSSDSDSDNSNDEIDQRVGFSRKKRDVDWCATNTETGDTTFNHASASSNRSRVVVWPPASNSTASNASYVPWSSLTSSQKYLGNPDYGTKMQLFSSTSYYLAINADGSVNGTRDKSDLHTKVQLINLGQSGRVRIFGNLTQQYLALDARGRPYAHYDAHDPNTEWQEFPVGNYKSYQNVHMLLTRKRGKSWFLGIKRNGKGKNGRKAKSGQKATKFLAIRP